MSRPLAMAAIDSSERNPTLFADTTCRKNLSTSSDGSFWRSCDHSCSIWLNHLESTDIRFSVLWSVMRTVIPHPYCPLMSAAWRDPLVHSHSQSPRPAPPIL